MQQAAGHRQDSARPARRITMALWIAVFLAASAVGAAGAAPAFAEPPEFGRCVAQAGGHFEDADCNKAATAGKEKFEWASGVVKNHFTTVIKPETSLTFETVGGAKYTCKHEESGGEIAGPKLVKNVTVTLKECLGFGQPCTSANAESGEIVTHSLEGVLGVEHVSTEGALKNKLALELKAEGGATFAEFSCAGIPWIVRGSILHPITANKSTNTYTEKYASSKGEQNPSAFAGEPDDSRTLESNVNGSPFEEMGWTITEIAKYEEKIEASTVN